ncbi:MAG: hypothetical protein IKU90_02610, partial [Clostridia bacterium]|nr:hypothetical protein [Clostridia bacterium]
EKDAFVTKIYNGEATTQAIGIYDGIYKLREKVDYIVTYHQNTEVGTAKVEIVGIGKYCGNYEGTYEIVKEWIVTIQSIKDQTYQNAKIEPSLKVKDGRKTLRKGIDYTRYIFDGLIIELNIKTGGLYYGTGIQRTALYPAEAQPRRDDR